MVHERCLLPAAVRVTPVGRLSLLAALCLASPGCTESNPYITAPPQDSTADVPVVADRGGDADARRDTAAPDRATVPDRSQAADSATDRGADLAGDLAVSDDSARPPDMAPRDMSPPDRSVRDRAVLDWPVPDQTVLDQKPRPDQLVQLPNGSSCTAHTQCYTGWCVDKVCCAGPCRAACMACNLSGSLGTCTFVAAGTDPDNDCTKVNAKSTCKLDGTCNGNGGCRFYPKGTVCLAARCANTTTAQAARLCDGGGTCLGSTTTTCSPYTCSSSTNACYSSCTRANENTTCQGYYRCNPAKTVCYSSCTTAAQCKATGKCVARKCVKK